MATDTVYTPTHLKRWEYPQCYAGATWYEYYSAGVGQSRDSEALERSNFAVMCRELEKIPEREDWPHDEAEWQVVRENHWAVGWVEWIAIHEDAEQHLRKADELRGQLEDFPVLDDEHHSEVIEEDCRALWEDCFDWRDRLRYLREHSHSGSLAYLFQAVRGSWYHAGNCLNCPSDILY